MITMILRVVFTLGAVYCLLCLPLSIAAAAAADEIADPPPPVALPNCAAACGNLTVPYPFGIGSGCFLDEFYEIECHRGSESAPLATLKNLMNVTVLKISLPEYIVVSQPVIHSDPNLPTCLGGTVKGKVTTSLNLMGSPYVYSQRRNVFVSGGCNNLALMVGPSMKSTVVGCRSTCVVNMTGSLEDCESGIGCCMNSIPYGLQAYTVDFKALVDWSMVTNGSCRYAFLVSPLDYDFPSNMTDSRALPSHVPVTLGWSIFNKTFVKMPISVGAYQYHNHGSSYECTYYYIPSHASDNPGPYVHCNCKIGFAGNPYLTNGCKDINECLIPNATSCLGKCVNIPGSYLCVDNNNNLALIGMGVGFGAIIVLLFSWWLYKFLRREAELKKKFFKRNGGFLLQQRLSSIEGNHMKKGKLFSLTELDTATDHFNDNRILGRGGQGNVYKGMLIDGTVIAVKKSKIINAGQIEQFVNEIIILSQINHRNVVKLLGFCLETEVPLLVYEFVSNGALFQYLHDPERKFLISWEMRLRIANEIAGVLSYLHFAAAIPVYHRDIKSSNILLDEKYRAKVADFGASRSTTIDQTHLTTGIKGTIGYLDPEYYQTCQFTDKSDVYSFGVVLVELLTGEKPISHLRAEKGRNLTTFFILSMEENRLFDVLDKEVLDHGEKEEIIAISNLAKRCLNPNGRYRPTMKEVAMELERVRLLRNRVIVQQNEEEIDRIRTGSVHGTYAVSTLMQSELDVDLTSWFSDLSR